MHSAGGDAASRLQRRRRIDVDARGRADLDALDGLLVAREDMARAGVAGHLISSGKKSRDQSTGLPRLPSTVGRMIAGRGRASKSLDQAVEDRRS